MGCGRPSGRIGGTSVGTRGWGSTRRRNCAGWRPAERGFREFDEPNVYARDILYIIHGERICTYKYNFVCTIDDHAGPVLWFRYNTVVSLYTSETISYLQSRACLWN